MRIKISAVDTLFFRDSKPFSMGDESWADGTFPPYPSVIYGALRTSYFSNHLSEFNKDILNTDKDPTFNLTVNELSYFYNNNKEKSFCYPIPLDCNYSIKNNKKEKPLIGVSIKKKEEDFYSNYPLTYTASLDNVFNSEEDIDTVNNGIINERNMNRYLSGTLNDLYYLNLTDDIKIEPKVGIARSFENRTSKDEHLYRVGMYRISKKLSFAVSFDKLKLNDKGILKLGGEGKSAVYSKMENNKIIEDPDFSDNDKYFKLYISTPAVFKKNGWFPDWIDPESNYEGLIPKTDIKVRLITAFTGKHNTVSGFDMKESKPKPLLRTVPAGSVYYFEIISNDYNWKDIINKLHRKSISSENYNKQGFGIAYLGKVTNIK